MTMGVNKSMAAMHPHLKRTVFDSSLLSRQLFIDFVLKLNTTGISNLSELSSKIKTTSVDLLLCCHPVCDFTGVSIT